VIAIRLSPPLEPRVQKVDVEAIATPSPQLSEFAERLVAAINSVDPRWPTDIPTAAGFDPAPFQRAAAVARALAGPASSEHDGMASQQVLTQPRAISGDGVVRSVFALQGGRISWQLSLELTTSDETPPAAMIRTCTLAAIPQSSRGPAANYELASL
jgi:hypothetical protein